MTESQDKKAAPEGAAPDSRDRDASAGQGAAFGNGTFWEGPAGWVLIMLILAAGVAGILYVYGSFESHEHAELNVVELELPEERPNDGRRRTAASSWPS
ncbi:hypothetical protein ACFL26_02230 [Patescibacteria group bacterium]